MNCLPLSSRETEAAELPIIGAVRSTIQVTMNNINEENNEPSPPPLPLPSGYSEFLHHHRSLWSLAAQEGHSGRTRRRALVYYWRRLQDRSGQSQRRNGLRGWRKDRRGHRTTSGACTTQGRRSCNLYFRGGGCTRPGPDHLGSACLLCIDTTATLGTELDCLLDVTHLKCALCVR